MPTIAGPPVTADVLDCCQDLARRARAASRILATVTGERKNRWLLASARALENRTEEIEQANARDVAAAEQHGLTAAQVDRLRLTPARIKGAADGLREVAALPDPVGGSSTAASGPTACTSTRSACLWVSSSSSTSRDRT
jgi:glutamate-5-semialdehyde dehydrogenase